MIWLAKTVNDRLNVVETLRFQTVKKRFACVSVDMKNAVTTVNIRQYGKITSIFSNFFSVYRERYRINERIYVIRVPILKAKIHIEVYILFLLVYNRINLVDMGVVIALYRYNEKYIRIYERRRKKDKK